MSWEMAWPAGPRSGILISRVVSPIGSGMEKFSPFSFGIGAAAVSAGAAGAGDGLPWPKQGSAPVIAAAANTVQSRNLGRRKGGDIMGQVENGSEPQGWRQCRRKTSGCPALFSHSAGSAPGAFFQTETSPPNSRYPNFAGRWKFAQPVGDQALNSRSAVVPGFAAGAVDAEKVRAPDRPGRRNLRAERGKRDHQFRPPSTGLQPRRGAADLPPARRNPCASRWRCAAAPGRRPFRAD